MIKDYEKQIGEESEKLKEVKKYIQSALMALNLDGLDISPSFEKHKLQYQEGVATINELKDAQEQQPATSSFFRKISSQLTNLANPLDILEEEKKLEPIMEKMVDELLLSKSSLFTAERKVVLRMVSDVNQLKRDLMAEKEEKQTGKPF